MLNSVRVYFYRKWFGSCVNIQIDDRIIDINELWYVAEDTFSIFSSLLSNCEYRRLMSPVLSIRVRIERIHMTYATQIFALDKNKQNVFHSILVNVLWSYCSLSILHRAAYMCTQYTENSSHMTDTSEWMCTKSASKAKLLQLISWCE